MHCFNWCVPSIWPRRPPILGTRGLGKETPEKPGSVRLGITSALVSKRRASNSEAGRPTAALGTELYTVHIPHAVPYIDAWAWALGAHP